LVVFSDSNALHALLLAPLQVLVVYNVGVLNQGGKQLDASEEYLEDSDDESDLINYGLSDMGCIRSLETFVWIDADLPPEHLIDVLAVNTHILQLSKHIS
jgi:hypothetical protein